MIWSRNILARSDVGWLKNSSGLPCSRILPWSMKINAVRNLSREAHLMGHAEHGHPLFRELFHRLQHFLDHLRIERRGRLIEQHDLRPHAERASDCDALLLPAGQLPRKLAGLVRNPDLGQEMHREILRVLLRHAADRHWRYDAVLQDRHVRKQVEALKHHAGVAPDGVDILRLIVQFGAVDVDQALVVLLDMVDAPDQRRLARTGRTADDDLLTLGHLEIDLGQGGEIAVVLVDCLHPNRGYLAHGRLPLFGGHIGCHRSALG